VKCGIVSVGQGGCFDDNEDGAQLVKVLFELRNFHETGRDIKPPFGVEVLNIHRSDAVRFPLKNGADFGSECVRDFKAEKL
jgi:hypothetical protein